MFALNALASMFQFRPTLIHFDFYWLGYKMFMRFWRSVRLTSWVSVLNWVCTLIYRFFIVGALWRVLLELFPPLSTFSNLEFGFQIVRNLTTETAYNRFHDSWSHSYSLIYETTVCGWQFYYSIWCQIKREIMTLNFSKIWQHWEICGQYWMALS